jgi:5''/3''-nucleotidase SurE
MKILMVNDDGFESEGIVKLADALFNLGNKITVVAPDVCKSGMSHAMTFRKPVFVKKLIGKRWDYYSASGTPGDCVMLGLQILKDDPPDLIVSGINNEPNLGTDLSYSGTVNAAIEGSLHEIRSIAISGNGKEPGNFDYIIQVFLDNFDYFYKLTTPNTAISINIDGSKREHKGIKFAYMGERKYTDIFTVVQDSEGHTYTLGGEPVHESLNDDSDVSLYKNGYVTVTPLSVDRTDFKTLEKWKTECPPPA